MDDNSDSSLEKKIANPDLEYKVDQEDEQLRKKKLSLTTSIALAALGFIVLGALIIGISTIFHSLKRKEKIDDDSINFNKISEDYSIENMQHRIDSEQQADKDDEDSEESDSDEDINDNTENANLSSSSDNEVKTPSAKPAPEPITFEYALENVDNEVSQPEQKEKENNEEGNSTDSSHTSNNVTTHHHDFVSADFEAIPARYRLSKGHNILCTLQNKIDTSYPGIATCVIAKPVFSDDGTTVLIERGSLVIGEQSGGLSGTHRAFISWREIKTPNDITIRISAPVSDNLGATGVNGKINYQLLKKFFLSTAISVIETGENYLVEKAKKPESAVVNLDSSNEMPMPQQFDELYKSMNEELIEKKTLVVNPGTQINVQLNQDLDFSTVYKNE